METMNSKIFQERRPLQNTEAGLFCDIYDVE